MSKNENLGEDNVGENINNIELTVKEVSNIIEETPNVIRNWMKELKPYIPLKKNASGYNVFDREALEKIKLIKQLHREQNYSIRQIEHYFATGGEAYKPTPEKGTDEILADDLKDIKKELSMLREEQHNQKDFNQELLKRLDHQQEYIDRRLEERHQKLDQFITEFREVKRLEAAASEEKKWWKFWK
ncbi:MerR family transcriptional regulator [Thalassorhabdus alkalitolerans]|uniref:MerR family transcriptional regulator n=1 Tax=Thalassorhabdus alkalitolerans TaxID=2282697 RepID=A0ABW0YSQ9_9BACI